MRRSSPSLETLQCLVDVSLMELCHVAVHLWIVVPDVPLRAPVRDSAKPERRREVIGTLELNTEDRSNWQGDMYEHLLNKFETQMRKIRRGD